MNKNNDVYSEQINIYLILGLLILCYGIFGLNGYGNIDSTYGLLNSWRWLIDHHRYVPSRFQGYLIPEIVVGFSSQIGSFYLSNFISSILSVSTLFTFYLLLRKITLPLIAIFYLVVAVSSSSKKTITCLTIIFSLNLLYSLVFNVDILDTHRPKVEKGSYTSANYSTGADLRLSIKKGILIKDFEWRALYQKDYVDDFNKNWRSSGFQLNDPRLFDIDPNY
jgi:hypothetical protein